MSEEIERIEVESSQIKSVGHDVSEERLYIEFKSGSLYRYSNVTQQIFDSLMDSESKGKYFHRVIRAEPEKFPFEKLMGPADKQEKEET
jgi:hypothetical protein